MKKNLAMGMATAMATAAFSICAFAGQWQQNASGWWYDNGNGTWPANAWMWIDGNNDGIAESYYFDQYGYCLMNTTTPDGYTVDANGAWVENGVVQTRQVAVSTGNTGNSDALPEVSNVTPMNMEEMTPVANKAYGTNKTNVRTSQNKLWGHALNFWYDGGYAEFFTEKQYNWLSLTAAPKEGFGEKSEYTLEIYGDNDEFLDSYDFDYKTPATDINVRITGQDYVKLIWVRQEGSSSEDLYMKNAVFH